MPLFLRPWTVLSPIICVLFACSAPITSNSSDKLQTSIRLRIVEGNLSSGNAQSYDDGAGMRIFEGLAPDVALIQEFNIGMNSPTEVRNTVDRYFGSDFSYFQEKNAQIPNGVISRYPIRSAGSWSDHFVGNRSYDWARIDIPGSRDLWVISVHLLTKAATSRDSEASELVHYIQANIPAGDYLALGGDFNTANRDEACVHTFASIFATSAPYPADQSGNDNTSGNRTKPHDWLIVNGALNPLQTAVVIGQNRFTAGLVFDSRVYSPLADVAPVQSGDSGAPNMQHMAVVKDFIIQDDNTADADGSVIADASARM